MLTDLPHLLIAALILLASLLVGPVLSLVVGSYLLPLAVRVARAWVWAYTLVTPIQLRERRRAEMASHVFELIEVERTAGYSPGHVGVKVLVRLLFGAKDDAIWASQHGGPRVLYGVVLVLDLAKDLALFILSFSILGFAMVCSFITEGFFGGKSLWNAIFGIVAVLIFYFTPAIIFMYLGCSWYIAAILGDVTGAVFWLLATVLLPDDKGRDWRGRIKIF